VLSARERRDPDLSRFSGKQGIWRIARLSLAGVGITNLSPAFSARVLLRSRNMERPLWNWFARRQLVVSIAAFPRGFVNKKIRPPEGGPFDFT